MKNRRHILFVNDRVRALIFLFIIMIVTILMVFAGIEFLKKLPNLDPRQKLYIEQINYPLVFQFMVIIIWGLVSTILAYLVLIYQYTGFLNRLHIFFTQMNYSNHDSLFPFRKNDRMNIIKDSLNELLMTYHQEMRQTEQELLSIRSRISIKKS